LHPHACSRTGGTLPGRTVPDGTSFAQTQDTERYDVGLVAQTQVDGVGTLHPRASTMGQDHLHRYGSITEEDRQTSTFAEASLSGAVDGTSWVGGLAFQSDGFRSQTFSVFDYSYEVPGLFAQVEQEVTPDLTFAATARVDFNNTYGTQFSPRLSALYRPGELDGAALSAADSLRPPLCRRDRGSRALAARAIGGF
jgi:iron complex outermembrane receptor protein